MEGEHDIIAFLRTRFDEVSEQVGRLRQEATEKLGQLDSCFDSMGVDLEKVRSRLDAVDARFDRSERRLDSFVDGLDRVDERFESLKGRLARLDLRADQADRERDDVEEENDATWDRFEDVSGDLQNLVAERLASLGRSLGELEKKLESGLAEMDENSRSAQVATERKMATIESQMQQLGERLQRLELPSEEPDG